MRWSFVGLLALTLLVSGCASSRVLHDEPFPDQMSKSGHKVVSRLQAKNRGVFLFYVIPLWSGSVSHVNRAINTTCRNYIKPKYVYMMLESQLRLLRADAVEDVEMKFNQSGWWSLGIFWIRTVDAQAVAVKYPKKRRK